MKRLLFYVDTCIWRDLLEDRKSSFVHLGDFAFQFLVNCRKHECSVYVSGLVLDELRNYFSDERISQLLSPFSDLLHFISASDEQMSEATGLVKKFPSIHRTDAIHAILSRDNNCVLITRDKHFDEIGGIIAVLRPEEVAFD